MAVRRLRHHQSQLLDRQMRPRLFHQLHLPVLLLLCHLVQLRNHREEDELIEKKQSDGQQGAYQELIQTTSVQRRWRVSDIQTEIFKIGETGKRLEEINRHKNLHRRILAEAHKMEVRDLEIMASKREIERQHETNLIGGKLMHDDMLALRQNLHVR